MSRRKKIAVGMGVAFLVLVLGACVFFRIQSPKDVFAYVEMSGFGPVWRELAFRRVGPGDLASELVQRHPPKRTQEFGRYAVYEYDDAGPGDLPMGGITVTARDGKLLSAYAASCTWKRTFFETPDADIDKQYESHMLAYMAKVRRTNEVRRMDKHATN